MPLVDQGRVSVREGYRVLISPRTPFFPFCGIWVDDPAQDAQIARELGAAVEEVEAAGTPCFVQVIEDRCPHVTAAAAELGLTERGRVVGMVAAPSGVRDAPDAAVSVRRVDERRAAARPRRGRRRLRQPHRGD